jgi:hypothetical protein
MSKLAVVDGVSASSTTSAQGLNRNCQAAFNYSKAIHVGRTHSSARGPGRMRPGATRYKELQRLFLDTYSHAPYRYGVPAFVPE